MKKRQVILLQMNRYERIPFEDDALPIRINFAAPIPEGQLKERYSWHEQTELLYFINGSARVYCDKLELEAKKGDVVFINPCQVHRVEAGSGTLYHCIMIDKALYGSCELLSIGRYFEPYNEGHLYFENHIRGDEKLNLMLDELCDELRDKAVGYELVVKAMVLKVFSLLFRKYLNGDGSIFSEEGEGYSRIKPAMELMKSRVSEHIGLKELASSCNVSQAHFCRIFKELCGRSPMQYFLELRLVRVAKLLKTTEKSVSEIAWESGFDDVSYLCRRFKERYGVTPGKLRNKKA